MSRAGRAGAVPADAQRRSGRIKKLRLTGAAGRKLTVVLRECRPGDEEGMIACIRDEYGETYFKSDFYSPAYLRKEADGGMARFLVAQTRAGEIAGMLLLQGTMKEDGMCEIASQIFRRKYRGYGLALPFFEYGMELLLADGYDAAWCRPVLFHDATQKLLYRLGLRATGFILNYFDMGRITHSYQNGRNSKHSMGIQVMSFSRREAGVIHVPKEHQAFCRSIYESLKVSFEMPEEDACGKEARAPASILSHTQNEAQSSLEIFVDGVGGDLPKRMLALHQAYPLRGRQTATVFLNLKDRAAVWAYHALWNLGYFFAGLKPISGGREYMALHHAGEVETWLEDYVLTEEFRGLAQYVRGFIKTKPEQASVPSYINRGESAVLPQANVAWADFPEGVTVIRETK